MLCREDDARLELATPPAGRTSDVGAYLRGVLEGDDDGFDAPDADD